jgi:hypothetical protein
VIVLRALGLLPHHACTSHVPSYSKRYAHLLAHADTPHSFTHGYLALPLDITVLQGLDRNLNNIAGCAGLFLSLHAVIAAALPGELVGSYYLLPETIEYEAGGFNWNVPDQAGRGVENVTANVSIGGFEIELQNAAVTNVQATILITLMTKCERYTYDKNDPCIASLMLRCGMRQYSIIFGIVSLMIAAGTAFSRRTIHRRISLTFYILATALWCGTFVIVRGMVLNDGFNQLYLNNGIAGATGSEGCGFKDFGPTPIEMRFGASYKLYIWVFVGSLLCLILKICDIKLDRPIYNAAVGGLRGVPHKTNVTGVQRRSAAAAVAPTMQRAPTKFSKPPPRIGGSSSDRNGGSDEPAYNGPVIELPPMKSRDSLGDVVAFPDHDNVGSGSSQPPTLQEESYDESTFV